MSDIAHIVNHLDTAHLDVLRHTLPTPSFKLVLDLMKLDYQKQQAELDISVESEKFKRIYTSLEARKQFVIEFEEFVVSLTEKTDGENHDSTL